MGYIWKALEKGYSGLHAVLTICSTFSSVLDDACVACCLLLSTGSYHVFIQIHTPRCCIPRGTTKTLGSEKGTLWRGKLGARYSLHFPAMQKSLVQPVRSNLHAPTRNVRFCPPQRPLLLQVNFGIVKCTPRRLPSMSFWPRALTLIWRKMSSVHSGTNTLERGVIRQRILYCTVEHVDKSAKHSFCITSVFQALGSDSPIALSTWCWITVKH